MATSRPGRTRVLVVLSVALLLAAAGSTLAAGATPPWKAPPFGAIGIQTIHLDGSHRAAEPSELAAFVETGSQNSHCLATLHEMASEASVRMLFCAPRNPVIDGNALEGIWLHVFFDGDPGDGLILDVNLYQEGAKFYGTPVLCQGPDGC